MNKTEVSIIIQNELDKCNEKTKLYDIKYNNNNNIKLLYDYLNDKKCECSETEQKNIMDDIKVLLNYI